MPLPRRRAEEQSPHVPRKTGNVLTAAWPIAINVMVAWGIANGSGTTSNAGYRSACHTGGVSSRVRVRSISNDPLIVDRCAEPRNVVRRRGRAESDRLWQSADLLTCQTDPFAVGEHLLIAIAYVLQPSRCRRQHDPRPPSTAQDAWASLAPRRAQFPSQLNERSEADKVLSLPPLCP